MTTATRFRIPLENEFGSDFIDAPDLKTIADRVVAAKLPDLDDGEMIIDYRWKAKGGNSGGNVVLGKCVKLSGLTRHYAMGAHFCIWLAADHLQARHFTEEQVEACIYHELQHIEREEPEDDDKGPVYRTRGHDVELFLNEIKEYGAYKANLSLLVDVVRQIPLPL